MADGSRVRDALLDAAYDAVARGEWVRTRMADVATTAGVSRQTLYNEFGSKDGLAAALVWRRIELFLNGIDALLTSHIPPGTADAQAGDSVPQRRWEIEDVAVVVSDSVRWVLATASADPLLKAILTSSQDTELLPFLTTRAGFLVTAARDRISGFAAVHWPWLPEDDVRLTADVVVRLIVSHLIIATDPVEVTAATMTTLVTRIIGLSQPVPVPASAAPGRAG
jgi:AcrR family transcriptional regulator